MGLYLIVAGDFVTTGGMDRANHALADFLARRGDTVHLVANRVVDDLASRPNVVVHRVPKPAGSYFLGGPLLDRVGRHWARRVAARGGRVIVNGGNCQWGDVNWVHYVHAAYTPQGATGLARRFKERVAHRAFLAAERRALGRARVVIANSRRTRRDLVDRLGVPAERVRVVYYGTDPDAFRPAPPAERDAARAALGLPADRPAVAFIGALGDRRKGFDTLLTAWERLCRGGDWPAVLVVVGTGAELPAWQRRAAPLGERVRFLGFRPDVPRVLAACDALVAPARYEAYGLGVHEALCRGLPAIVSRDAGVAERCSADLGGLLIDEPDSPDELADRLRRWRGTAPRYKFTAEGLASELRQHTWERMAADLLAAASPDPRPRL